MRAVAVVVGHTVQEGLRRRIFLIVLLLTAGFVTLYAVGAHYAFRDAENFAGTTPA